MDIAKEIQGEMKAVGNDKTMISTKVTLATNAIGGLDEPLRSPRITVSIACSKNPTIAHNKTTAASAARHRAYTDLSDKSAVY